MYTVLLTIVCAANCLPQLKWPGDARIAKPNVDAARYQVPQDRVELDYGVFQGGSNENCTFYKNVPFAKAPVGSLRFQPPVDLEKSQNVYDATQFGFGCIQNPKSGGLNGAGLKMSEDCLNLNVFMPKTDKKKLPVVVYVHGGGFNSGYAAHPYFDPCSVGKDHITITFNYRVGIFGFLAAKELAMKKATNVGLMDQQKVFEWVKKYAHLFSGDADDVTAFGQSAGAISIATHMMRNDVQPYFSKAILHSGGPGLFMPPVQESFYNSVLTQTGCADIACLQTADGDVLYKLSIGVQFFPILDGNFVKQRAKVAFAQEKVWNIPVMLNTVSSEGQLFTMSIKEDSMAQRFIDTQFGFMNADQRSRLFELYPRDRYSTSSDWVGDMYGDAGFQCPSWLLQEYYSPRTQAKKSIFNLGNGMHGSDLPYFWNYQPQVTDSQLSLRMVKMVNQFVAGAQVSGFDGEGILDLVQMKLIKDDRAEKCRFWTSI